LFRSASMSVPGSITTEMGCRSVAVVLQLDVQRNALDPHRLYFIDRQAQTFQQLLRLLDTIERIGSNKISQSEVDWVISQAG
jgi:hypothetical protein